MGRMAGATMLSWARGLWREAKDWNPLVRGIGGATGLAPEGWDAGILGSWDAGTLESWRPGAPPALPSGGRIPRFPGPHPQPASTAGSWEAGILGSWVAGKVTED